MTPNRRCDSCSASHEVDGGLFCKLNPPQVTIIALPDQDSLGRIVPRLTTLCAQPPVKSDGYCMKWAPFIKLMS